MVAFIYRSLAITTMLVTFGSSTAFSQCYIVESWGKSNSFAMRFAEVALKKCSGRELDITEQDCDVSQGYRAKKYARRARQPENCGITGKEGAKYVCYVTACE